MNPNWTRWIRASIVKHFDAARSSIHLYVEGRKREQPEPTKRFELRIDGPSGKEVSKGYWKLGVEINVLISMVRDPSDAYGMERLTGIVQAAFTNSITVMTYGETTPAERLGCLTLRRDGREAIITSEFGLIDAAQGLRQATVEGHYKMELRT